MRVLSLGGMALDGSLRGALSVGPLLETEYFAAHPINKDLSLGGKPPFLDVPLARTVLYGTADEKVHIQLFDGRPVAQSSQALLLEGRRVWLDRTKM